MTADWQEIADRVYVRRYPVLDVNSVLVVGESAALVVDTLATPAQGRDLAAAVRRLTPHPWLVVNTHHHFDHAYGNQAFAGAEIWAHDEAARLLRETTPTTLAALRAEWEIAEPELAELTEVTVVPPTRTLRESAELDLGVRQVRLRHLGRGHTAGDVVVHVPDAGVVVAGDLVEQDAAPSFEDAYPLEWPHTLTELLHLVTGPVVPGHGAVVDHGFVKAQHDELNQLAWLIREGHADGADPRQVAARAPYGPDAALVAVTRGYAELSGRA
ncbi:MAG: MBL fold metallo-hydrolase [Micromonosporaceae bacterium]